MAQSLFIDIFGFTLHKIKSSYNTTTPSGGIGTRYVTEKEAELIGNFYNCLEGDSTEAKFLKLISDFIGQFNSKYIVTRDKGISMHPKLFAGYEAKKCTLWGEFSGGLTGREQRVFNIDNSEKSEYIIDKQKMVASPYFYMLWLPSNCDMGILIVQRYSNTSCSSEFKNALANFFLDKGYRPTWMPFIPKEICKEYLSSCALTGVKIVHSAPSVDKFKNTIFDGFASDRGVSFGSTINGLHLSFDKLFNTGKFAEDFKGFISAIDMNYQESDEVFITYTNSDGITAKVSLKNFDEVMPKIALDADCFNEGTFTPEWTKITSTCQSYLDSIKKQIGYTPNYI